MTVRDYAGAHFASLRLYAMVIVFLAVAVPFGILGSWSVGPAVGWAATCALFIVSVWVRVGRLDAEQTREHARSEDPGRRSSDVLLTTASLASIGAVFVLLVGAKGAHGFTEFAAAGTAVLCVALSWGLIHTLYMLRYARTYYTDPIGGIDFNTDVPPRYIDFAYVAFDLGMTFQVSDTSLSTSELRGIVLRHTLLSYLFGTVVLASVINLVAGLS